MMTLAYADGALGMSIEDDGCGPPARRPSGAGAVPGLGVIGMRERAQALGGTFTFESRGDGGTRVAVRLPTVPQVPQLFAADAEVLAG